MKTPNSIIIGIKGHVVSLEPSTGRELWRTKLKGGQFVTVYPREKQVFGGVTGELFCVDRATGRIEWQNKMPKLGFGIISFAADPGPSEPRDLVVGIKGHLVSIDAATGSELWRTKLKNGSYTTVAHLDSSTVLGAVAGELFAVNRSVGNILWNAELKKLGLGLVSLGSNEISIAAAIAQAQQAAAT